jgi:hypothetical protein
MILRLWLGGHNDPRTRYIDDDLESFIEIAPTLLHLAWSG